MPRSRNNSTLAFCIGVSIFGLLLVIVWTINPPISDNFSWRKPLIGSLFSLICILGVFAALSPNRCSEALHFREAVRTTTTDQILSASHHPNCERFSAHVIHLKERVLCAACTGLLLGAVVALVGAFFYFFGGWQIESVRLLLVLIGLFGLLAGFLQLRFRGLVRLTANSLFVLGAFLCLVGVDQASQNVAIDLFLVILIIFWILTRIQLSRWDHSRICDNCDSPCRSERTRKDKARIDDAL